MEIVFNDYSLNSQFTSTESFADSLTVHTLPLLELLSHNSSVVLKKYESYNLKITPQVTLNDFLTSNQFKGYTESQKLRSLLVDLICDPYWEDNPKSKIESIYETTYTGSFSGGKPNCFSEAYARDKVLLSVENSIFQNNLVGIVRDGISDYINNFYSADSAVNVIFQNGFIGFSELLYNYKNDVDIAFFNQNNMPCIDKEFDDFGLSIADAHKVVDYFKNWIIGIKTGNMLTHLTDSINYKGIGYNELRISLDDKREFRLFYKLFGSKYVFFNSLVKSTQTTPDCIKEKTYNQIKKYSNM